MYDRVARRVALWVRSESPCGRRAGPLAARRHKPLFHTFFSLLANDNQKQPKNKVEFVAADGTHTQRIEAQWRALHRKFHPGVLRHDDIRDHLIEYMWRRKCRQEGVDPFADLVRIQRTQ